VAKRKSKSAPSTDWVPVEGLDMRGWASVQNVRKSSYHDNSMVVIIPSRTPFLHTRFVQSLDAIRWPMNGKRAKFHVSGAEVGEAYDEHVALCMSHPELSTYKYVLTIEDDNLVPPDAAELLCEAIEMGPFDAVGGLYFLKGDLAMGQAYGSPEEFRRTGVLDFRPRDMTEAIKNGMIVPVNGIAMGCSLYRMSMFKDIPRPWFRTNPSNTQDLFFCNKAASAGKKFAVDARVRVGHADWTTGIVY
jgi:hypothetical protein